MSTEDYDEVCAKVRQPRFAKEATHAQVLWGKIGSYPFWPAQVVPEDKIKEIPALMKARRPKAATTAVMFFGEYTYGYLPDKSVLPWSEGIDRGCEKKSWSLIKVAVREVADFLDLKGNRKAPEHWWSSPPSVAAKRKEVPTTVKADDRTCEDLSSDFRQEKSEKESTVANDMKNGTSARWSSRELLRPFICRMKELCPALRNEPVPNKYQELTEWIKNHFGDTVNVDATSLKGKTQFDLLAEFLGRVTKQPCRSNDVEACFRVPGCKRYRLNEESLAALLGIRSVELNFLSHTITPLQTSNDAIPIPVDGDASSVVSIQAPSTQQQEAPSEEKSEQTIMEKTHDVPQREKRRDVRMRVVNGKVIVPRSGLPSERNHSCGNRSKSNSDATTEEVGVGEGDGTQIACTDNAVEASPLNVWPDYVHIKQNAWVSKPRPKRLPREEIETCCCEPASELNGMESSGLVEALPRRGTGCKRGLNELRSEDAASSDNIRNSKLHKPDATMRWGMKPEGYDVDVLITMKRLEEAVVELVDGSNAIADEGMPAADVANTVESMVSDDFEPRGDDIVSNTLSVTCIELPSAQPQRQARRKRNSLIAPEVLSLLGRSGAGKCSGVHRDSCRSDCLNRLSFIHCDSKTCPAGVRCSNRPFHQLKHPPMEVFLTENKGWGVRALSSIRYGTFIAEYVGEIIDEYEMRLRMEAARQQGEPHFYMMELSPGLVIDARSKGNVARLINSSCDPNCETQKWRDAATGEMRVGIFTVRDVAAGEELCYNYNFQQLYGQGGEYACRCGAPSCLGNMDSRHQATHLGRRLEIYWDGDDCYYPGKIIGCNPSARQHTILYDDGEVHRYQLEKEKFRWIGNEEVDTEAALRKLVTSEDNSMKEVPESKGSGTIDGLASQQAPMHAVPHSSESDRLEETNGMSVLERDNEAHVPENESVLPVDLSNFLKSILPCDSGIDANDLMSIKEGLQPVLPILLTYSKHLLEKLSSSSLFRGADDIRSHSDSDARCLHGNTHDSSQSLASGAATYAHDGSAGQDSLKDEALVYHTPSGDLDSISRSPMASSLMASHAELSKRLQVDVPSLPRTSSSSEDQVVGQISWADDVRPTVESAFQETASGSASNPLKVGGNNAHLLEELRREMMALSKESLSSFVELQPGDQGDVADLGTSSSSPFQNSDSNDMDASQVLARRELCASFMSSIDISILREPLSEEGARARCEFAHHHLQLLFEFFKDLEMENNENHVVDNPGAEAVAGRLHGNGTGVAKHPGRGRKRGGDSPLKSKKPENKASVSPKAKVGISTRGRRRQPKSFGDDFEQEAMARAQSTKEQKHGLLRTHEAETNADLSEQRAKRPRRQRYEYHGTQKTETPSIEENERGQNALHVDEGEKLSTANGEGGNEDQGLAPANTDSVSTKSFVCVSSSNPRKALSAAALRRAARTAPSTGLPARTILVAKRLTNSDVTKGRILLPRAAVEANLSFAVGRAHSLTARDHHGDNWEFTLQSWANGVETRRVYVLEHAGDFIRRHGLKLDDVIGISTTEEGIFLVEYNTDEVCSAAETQMAARGPGGSSSPLVSSVGFGTVGAAGALPGGPLGLTPASANPLIQHNDGRCTRSEYCNKPAGHPGFCLRKPPGSGIGGASARHPAGKKRGGRSEPHGNGSGAAYPQRNRPSQASMQREGETCNMATPWESLQSGRQSKGLGGKSLPSYGSDTGMKSRSIPVSFGDVGRPKRARVRSKKLSSYRLDTEDEDDSYSEYDEGDYHDSMNGIFGGDDIQDKGEIPLSITPFERYGMYEKSNNFSKDVSREGVGDLGPHISENELRQNICGGMDNVPLEGMLDAVGHQDDASEKTEPYHVTNSRTGGGKVTHRLQNSENDASQRTSPENLTQMQQHWSGSYHQSKKSGQTEAVPPIFVMAPEAVAHLPPISPSISSPLRPSMAARQNSLPTAPSLNNVHSVGSHGPFGHPNSSSQMLSSASLPPTLPLTIQGEGNANQQSPSAALDVASFLVGNSPIAASAEQKKQGAQYFLQQGEAVNALTAALPPLPKAWTGDDDGSMPSPKRRECPSWTSAMWDADGKATELARAPEAQEGMQNVEEKVGAAGVGNSCQERRQNMLPSVPMTNDVRKTPPLFGGPPPARPPA